MSRFIVNTPIEHLPKPTEYQLSGAELQVRLNPLGLEKAYLWDYNYWYISLEDWGKVLKDVLFGMPKYTTDKFDCENFAMLVSARVSERYHINTCGIAIGKSPFGYHGYNLLVYEEGLMIFEPQNGMFYSIDNPEGYKPELVIFG